MSGVLTKTDQNAAKGGLGLKDWAKISLPILASIGAGTAVVEYTLLHPKPVEKDPPAPASAPADPGIASTLTIVKDMQKNLNTLMQETSNDEIACEILNVIARLDSQITINDLTTALEHDKPDLKPVFNNADVNFILEKLTAKYNIEEIRTTLKTLEKQGTDFKKTAEEYEKKRVESAEKIEYGLEQIWGKVVPLGPRESKHYPVTAYAFTRSHGEFRPTQPGGLCLAPVPGTPRKTVTEHVVVRQEYGPLFEKCASANEKLFGVMWGEPISANGRAALKAELEEISNTLYKIARNPVKGQEFCSILTPSELMEAYQETKSLHVAIAAKYDFSQPQTTKTKTTLDMVIAKLLADGTANAARAAAPKAK